MESAQVTNEELSELQVRTVERSEETRYQEQMARHHYLGELPKIGETLWYIATWRKQWVAKLSMSAAALKCGVRDRWIGWVSQYRKALRPFAPQAMQILHRIRRLNSAAAHHKL